MSQMITTPPSNVAFGAQGTLDLNIIFMSLVNAGLHYLDIFLVILTFLFLRLNNVDFEIIGLYVKSFKKYSLCDLYPFYLIMDCFHVYFCLSLIMILFLYLKTQNL